MTKLDIQDLLIQLQSSQAAELIETPISWVLVTDGWVYKFKKPMRRSYLDFSSIETRRYFCYRELELNRRLAPEIYVDVVPISVERGYFSLDDDQHGRVIDYALKMKRMDGSREMNVMLEKGTVTPQHIHQLIEQLIPFHLQARVIHNTTHIGEMKRDFADILTIEKSIQKHFGIFAKYQLRHSIQASEAFIEGIAARLLKRSQFGMVRDVHGDLQARNVVLDKKKPIIFDCLEFNDEFRYIDVLEEIAYLCMDLESYGEYELSELLIHQYNKKFEIIHDETDWLVFKYYKWYRANARLKAEMRQIEGVYKPNLEAVNRYWELYRKYEQELTKSPRKRLTELVAVFV